MSLVYTWIMEIFESAFGRIELTEERASHILEFHPEVKGLLKQFKSTLQKPDIVRKSKFDDKVYIFYRLTKQKFLAIVVKTNHRCFVLTAYLTDKPQYLPI